MYDEDKNRGLIMDRPVGSLLNIRIGTVAKAYAIYLAIGLGIGLVVLLIGLAIVTSHSGGSSAAPGLGQPGSLTWGETGDRISAVQYRSIEKRSTEAALRRSFGTPATVAHNPTDLVSGDRQRCLGYRSSTAEGSLYLFCFANGRLVDKQIW